MRKARRPSTVTVTRTGVPHLDKLGEETVEHLEVRCVEVTVGG